MVAESQKYFQSFSEKQRVIVKDIIRIFHEQEHEADRAEDRLKRKVFSLDTDPTTVFHTVRLAETIGTIGDHAQNAGDIMRAMVAR